MTQELISLLLLQILPQFKYPVVRIRRSGQREFIWSYNYVICDGDHWRPSGHLTQIARRTIS